MRFENRTGSPFFLLSAEAGRLMATPVNTAQVLAQVSGGRRRRVQIVQIQIWDGNKKIFESFVYNCEMTKLRLNLLVLRSRQEQFRRSCREQAGNRARRWNKYSSLKYICIVLTSKQPTNNFILTTNNMNPLFETPLS